MLAEARFYDCVAARNRMAAFIVAAKLSPSTEVTFQRNSGKQFPLPTTFSAQTCVIWLDMVNETAQDTFEIQEIFEVATVTTMQCAIPPNSYGGKTVVGPKKVMEFMMFGRTWPFDEDGAGESEGAIESALAVAR